MKNINKLTNGLDSENSIFLSQIKSLDDKLHLKYNNSDSIIAELFRRADEKMHLRYPCLEPEDESEDESEATHDYSQDYLTFVALENGTFTFNGNTLQYSLDDGATWNTLASNTASPTVTTGDTIMWKQTGLTPTFSAGIGTFSSTGNFKAQGNVMSLHYGDDFVGQISLIGKSYAFCKLFRDCTRIVSCEGLILPATTLTKHCYQQMFYGCTSLTTAPELPATILETNCYDSMFYNCTSLMTAPELPAATLCDECYIYMFYNCSNLNYIKCLATSKESNALGMTSEWVTNVAEQGTFVKKSGYYWRKGEDGIPTGWTVQTES